uniref:Uncharacterized protein n=1 Tax=Glossina brevipalpis TaxID=37001 RepID=A0A1A9WXP1_9MUSC
MTEFTRCFFLTTGISGTHYFSIFDYGSFALTITILGFDTFLCVLCSAYVIINSHYYTIIYFSMANGAEKEKENSFHCLIHMHIIVPFCKTHALVFGKDFCERIV